MLFRTSEYKYTLEVKLFANTCLRKILSQNMQRTLTQTTLFQIGKDLNGHLAREDTDTIPHYAQDGGGGGQKHNVQLNS